MRLPLSQVISQTLGGTHDGLFCLLASWHLFDGGMIDLRKAVMVDADEAMGVEC